MSKRDFFILMIKLFGLFSAIATIVKIFPGNFSYIGTTGLYGPIWILFSWSLILTFFLLLVLKADTIVNMLKLDRGFDEPDIDLGKYPPSAIIKLGLFIIGGLLIIDNLPVVLSNGYFWVKSDINFGVNLYEHYDRINTLTSALKVLIGYVLIRHYDFFERLLRVSKEVTPDSVEEES